jgi:PAS domain S-box-containing protein
VETDGPRRTPASIATALERERVEEALRISEAHLAFAQQAARAGIWHWDLGSGQWYWSDQLYRIFGWDPRTSPRVTIDAWRAALHPDDRAQAEANLLRALADGTPLANEDRIVLPSGEIRWVNALGRTTYGADGKPLAVSGICVDITERKRTEEALQASEAVARQRLLELEAIYETAPIGLCVLDENLRWVRLNRIIAEINGKSIEEHIGRTPREIIPDVGEQAEEALRTILRTGERPDFEMRGTTAAQPGVERVWSEHWLPLKDPEGRIVGISVAAEEVTERQRAVEALAESEERYRTLAENAPEAISRLDADMRFTYINAHGAGLYGLRPSDVIGRTIEEIVTDRELVGFARRQFDEVRRTGEHRTVEIVFDSPVSGRQNLSVVVVPERSEPFSMLVITRDITPLKRVEQELREREAALRESDRQKNEFLAVLSHELRNPLSVIHGNVAIIERAGLESGFAKRAFAALNRQVGVMVRLLDDLLDVTRISKGKIRLQPERISLSELVRTIGEDRREAFDRQGVHFEVRVPDEPLPAQVDRARISQIVGNLLQNAAKFTPAEGHVSLSLALAADRHAIIEVCDDGAGIRRELLGRLFEPLVQDERTITKSQGGLGLGLALVKGLVELHGGTVSAASDGPGCGSVFTIRLPLPPAL